MGGGGAHGISLRDLPGTARPEPEQGREGRKRNALRSSPRPRPPVHLHQSSAERGGGRQGRTGTAEWGREGWGWGGWREEGVKGMKGKKSEKQRTAFVTGAKKTTKKNEQNSEVVSQTSGSTLGRGVGVGGGL